jgi:hypothetical protein
LKDTRIWGLAQTGYSFLDPGLLATFLDRWHGDTSTFHLPCGEMTMTLDDVCCLLHLPVQGCLLNHIWISSKAAEVIWMNELFGTMDREAEDEVRKPKGAHI